jgi:hypothetical protein
MSTQNTGQDANITGAAPRGGDEYGVDRPNFSSARSDYGSYAYGGTLNESGTGGSSVDDFSQGRRVDDSSRGSGNMGRRSGTGSSRGGASAGLMLLAGVGIGAILMYIFDPDQGRRRRALLRDQMVGLSNDASDAIGKKARDLRNRAQGVIAETSSMLGIRGETNRQKT